MISSGVLAFYLSETEDPELWRAMAQLTQDERTAFFKSALSYLLIEEGLLPASGYADQDQDQEPRQHLFTSAQANPDWSGQYPDYPGQHPDLSGQHTDYPGQHPDLPGQHTELPGHHTDFPGRRPDQDYRYTDNAYVDPGAPLYEHDWFDDNDYESPQANQPEVRGTRHTLTPTFSQPRSQYQAQSREEVLNQAQAQLMSHQARLREMFTENASPGISQNTRGHPSDQTPPANPPHHPKNQPAPIVQPEITDPSLDDIYSDTGQNLRGLDFLLKNVIGEETDDAVLEAIRRKKAR